ncbi:MAG: permease [Variibacter sp.]|nr:permease [Variibacter sp.]
MNMTHYMELLAVNQPWNLLIFMGGPIVLAETIAVTELYILYTRRYDGPVRALNRACSILVGLYFSVVFAYLLFKAVIPLTVSGGWRGPADVIAVGFYLLGIVPLLGLTLVDLRLIGRDRDEHGRMAIHAGFVALFLVVGHIAMIFGMMDPAVLGATAAAAGHGH